MASTLDTSATDLVTVERTLDRDGDDLVARVTARTVADTPVVVRVSDPVGEWSGADSVRIHPEVEPERWTVDDATLVAELLVRPDAPATVTYDLQHADEHADPAPMSIEQAQPTDPETVEAGRVPRFRDTQTFDGRDGDTQLPTGEGEATDADVREAVDSVLDPQSGPPENELLDQRLDPLDLADPDDESGE